MSYNYNGTNQYMTVNSAPVTAAPATLAVWFNKTGNSPKNGIFLRNSADNQNLFGFYFGFSNAVRGYCNVTADFAAGGSYSTGTWGHVCYVEASSTSRTIYRNGGNSNTNTTSIVPIGINQIDIAHYGGAGTFDGQFAEFGIWNAALNASEINSLWQGMTCDKIRPQSLVFYAPLVRNLIDYKNGVTINNINSSTVAVHPRVYA